MGMVYSTRTETGWQGTELRVGPARQWEVRPSHATCASLWVPLVSLTCLVVVG